MKSSWSVFRIVAIAMAGILGLGNAHAQSTNSGDIRGTVTDPSGALIPGVTVTVAQHQTGVTKDYPTNNDGLYDTKSDRHRQLQAHVHQAGFETFVRGPITVQSVPTRRQRPTSRSVPRTSRGHRQYRRLPPQHRRPVRSPRPSRPRHGSRCPTSAAPTARLAKLHDPASRRLRHLPGATQAIPSTPARKFRPTATCPSPTCSLTVPPPPLPSAKRQPRRLRRCGRSPGQPLFLLRPVRHRRHDHEPDHQGRHQQVPRRRCTSTSRTTPSMPPTMAFGNHRASPSARYDDFGGTIRRPHPILWPQE